MNDYSKKMDTDRIELTIRIIEYLKEHGSITYSEFIDNIGVITRSRFNKVMSRLRELEYVVLQGKEWIAGRGGLL